MERKTKNFYGVEFNVYTETKIEGDFIHPEEAVYFENDVEITGNLKVKYLKCEKSIKVGGNYIVEKWEEIGGYQEVGWYQEIGGYQEIGEYQKIGKYQEIGGYQEIGEYQKIGGSLKAKSSRVGLYSKVKGEYNVEGRVFIGVCEWKETTEEEETLTCGKFVSGRLMYGKLKEIGLPEEKPVGKKVKIRLPKGTIIEGELIE